MNEKEYFIISSAIFIAAAALHGARFLGGFNLVYAGITIPAWISALVAVIGVAMACYGLKFRNAKKRR